MQEKMSRFLKSIGLNTIERFDLAFSIVERNPMDRATLDMHIMKDKPWRYDLLREFIDALHNITYKYTLTFSYRNEPKVSDAIALYKEWFKSLNLIDSKYIPYEKLDSIYFDINVEDKDIYLHQIDDFNEFLKFICYEIPVRYNIIKPVVEEEPVKIDAPVTELEPVEDFSKEKTETVLNVEETIEQDFEEENIEIPEIEDEDEMPSNNNEIKENLIQEGEVETVEEEIKDYENLLLEQMNKNLQEMIEERKRMRTYQRGGYVPIDNIRQLRQRVDENINVDFFGNVFELKSTKLRSKNPNEERFRVSIGIGDPTSAIYVTAITNSKSLPADKVNAIKVGMNLRVRGYLEKENGKDTGVFVHYLDVLPPTPLRTDEMDEKRVELHLHTKFSAFDGLSTIMEYCKTAKSMGHKAIAITDHGVAQSYPDAQKAEKETGIRIIYGSELYMVDNVLECAFNLSDRKLDNATYCVFDFETTGLSSRYDQIIEFGACRYENGMPVDQIDLFVKPTIPIPKKIVNLTGITEDMVKDAVGIKEALKIIENFSKDAIFVTHNAHFDIGFLNAARVNNGLEPVTNPVIDTLAISRYLFPEARRHNLGALCKNMEITSYNEDEAHRADFDARVLAEVWMAILSKITRQNPNLKHNDLSKFEFSNKLMTHFKPIHVTALCKDEIGLKDLYKVISQAHIDYFSGVPRIPRSELNKYRDHLLLGSACVNGEVWDLAHTKSEEELMEAMKYYDFIEIQPPENFSFLTGLDEMSPDQIKRNILDIVSAAKKLNKKIVVTGDVHYCNPDEKIYRDIYIVTKGIGNTNHPLNPYYRKNYPHYDNPNQHYRSTKEMYDSFDFLSDDEKYEYIIKNSNEIADMCAPLKPVKDHLYKPTIPNSEENLRKVVFEKARKLYGDALDETIEKRLEDELVGICGNGYAVTYSIARDIILKANEDGFIVGSRGSVGSSFVATMADITEINSLAPHYRCPKCRHFEWANEPGITSGYDLPDKVCPDCGEKMIHDGQNIPFATFLGFHAEKVPDIDLNFPADYQSKAHDFTKVLFGEQNVYRAGTIGTVADKTAYGYVRKYYENEGVNPDTVPSVEIAYLASHCTEVKRTTGQHPGGIVVVPKENDVFDFCPIQYPADEPDSAWRTTHFEFSAIHDTLLKLDLLGHDDPMVIKMMCEEIGINYKDIPLNDPDVLSLFSSGNALKRKSNYLKIKSGALGLPEFGTNFVRGILDVTHPKTFAELVIISGLSHGTDVWQGNAELLIKNNVCTLRDVIGCRDDIMLYLVSKGVEPSIAFKTMEDVRKGKKVKPEYAEELKKHDVPDYYIDSCNKIQYMFPKAHACAYVTNALRVAYFKVHYPLVYYAIYFTVRCDKFDIETMFKGEEAIIEKIEELNKKKINTENHSIVDSKDKFTNKDDEVLDTLSVALEMYERGYKIDNIDIYQSLGKKFVVNNANNSILPPFNTIDGLGDVAAESIVEARKEGQFTSKDDLLRRTKCSQTHVKVLDELGVLKDLSDKDQIDLFDFSF